MTALEIWTDDSGFYVEGHLVGTRPDQVNREAWINLAENLNFAGDLGNDICELPGVEAELEEKERELEEQDKEIEELKADVSKLEDECGELEIKLEEEQKTSA